MIELRPVTPDNHQAVIALSSQLTYEDRKKVADNVVSLADAYVYDFAWPRAIYQDATLIGFLMLGFDDFLASKEDTPTLFIWRLMLTPEYQNQGIGKEVLRQITLIAMERNLRFIHVFVHNNTPMPKSFYLKNGFIDTHVVYEDEVLLKKQVTP